MSKEREWSGFEIAVIGLAGRFPGARDIDALWHNLEQGVESIRVLPLDELRRHGRSEDDLRAERFVPAHGALEDFDRFDAEFFGFRPAEAEALDPQHRIFLEVVWEALENAGYDPARYRGLIGVFAGSSADHYLYDNVRRNPALISRVGDFQAGYSNLMDHLATRVSYKLDLVGPSFAIQSACSTSLVAAHVACQQLLTGACDIAIAGGVSLTLPIEWGYRYEDGMIRSPDGHCRAFDADAQGCLKGDGAGAVVLKRLVDALADGDRIEAVILGSAVNNDGSRKVGYTAPGLEGQARVIDAAHAVAGIPPDTIGYVEAHGTGTPVGDPIEIAALTKVFRRTTQRRQFCGIGSIKTNFGHLDAAAGVAGLIKTILALRQRTLPPSLHFRRPNPNIDLASSPFFVVDHAREWEAAQAPRRAAVSSFGIGGTNAHIVLEEAPPDRAAVGSAASQIVALSARSQQSLDEATERLADHLARDRDVSIADVAYTLQVGRHAFSHRRAIVCATCDDAVAKLRQAQASIDGTVGTDPPSPVFLFPGQGAQYVGMAHALYESEPAFGKHVDRCADLLQPLLGLDIRRVLYPPSSDDRASASERLKQTELAQPALFVVEYALAQWLIDCGVEPVAMIGHSVGEYVAACVADVLALDDALKLVAARGRLMQSQRPGGMIAVPLSAETLEPYLGGALSLAAENAPSLCVVAGPVDAVAALADRLRAAHAIECTRLHTSHAFHSSMMEPAVAPFVEALREVPRHAPKRRCVSTVTGTWLGADDVSDAAYWARNIRDTVRYSRAVRTVLELGDVVLLEVGPGTALTSLARKQSALTRDLSTVSSLRHPHDEGDERAHTLSMLARLWTAGLDIRWPALHEGQHRRRVALPTYAFQRERYWSDPADDDTRKRATTARMPSDDWFYLPSWTRTGATNLDDPVAGRWLIVAAMARDAEPVVEQLAAAAELITVWTLDQPFDERLQELADSGRTPQHIVYLGGLQSSVDGGYQPLARLARALAACDAHAPLAITIVAEEACSVIGTENVRPERILPMGIAQVLPSEMENIRCRFVDIETADPKWARRIVGEALCESAESLVAYRNGQRWRRTVEPVRLQQHAASPARLRRGGVYLVTGGLGGMGLELAAYLARTAAAKLVLAGRSPFPDREHWPRWLAEHAADEPIARSIVRIGEMESLGARVMVARVDVSDAHSLAQLRARIHGDFGSVNGVIHAAGVPGAGVIALHDDERATRVFAAKVDGTRVVYESLRADAPDFIVLCSSLTSVIPRVGRADYTAANLFLDAFAHGTRDTRVVSINWDNWSDVGMARTAGGERVEGLSNDEGIGAFARVMSHDYPQVFVSTHDLRERVELARRVTAAEPPPRAIDAAAQSAARHARPALVTAYEAPRDDVERTLASIWQDLLGVERVGIRDNFFELGGDSVVSIQLVARARKARLNVTAKQVFENATIAELASAATASHTGELPASAQEPESSHDLALSPIQQWFFELPLRRRNHWNIAAVFETPPQIDVPALRIAIARVLGRHQAFALRFRESSRWRQTIVANALPTPEIVDLSATPDDALDIALDRVEATMHPALDIRDGPLVRVTIVTLGAQRPGRLLIVAHHLTADVISLRLLAEELEDAYARARHNEADVSPEASMPFARWVQRLDAFAQSAEIRAELPYWSRLATLAGSAVPLDDGEGANTAGSSDIVAMSLDAQTTKRLTERASSGGAAGGLAALLGTLARTIAEWSDAPHAWIDVEGHGREPFADDVDVSRTVGWFTALHPMALPRGADLRDAIALAGEHIRQMPRRGFGYGLLRFLQRDADVRALMSRLPRPDIVFLYQGQLTREHAATDGMRVIRIGGDRCRAADERRSHVLEVNARIDSGVLRVDWGFSRQLHRRETIERLSARFETALREFANDRVPLPDATPAQATSLAVPVRKARLSFAQERIWFLEQLAPGEALYNKQAVVKIAGELDVDALAVALQRMIARHETLRTRITVADGVPMQVIDPPWPVELRVVDRDADDAALDPDMAALWRSLAREPFDLEAGAPLRVTLARTSPREHWLGITFHHIITDAWSVQVFVRELGVLYCAQRRGTSAPLPPLPIAFADFAERQRASFTTAALDRHLEYWTRTLAGVLPLDLPTDRHRPPVQRFEGARVPLRWPGALTAELRALARSSGVSLFMVLLAIFKMLLQRYSLQDDIVVGVPAADRPDVDTETLIGPLVNNIVMRTDLSGNPAFRRLLERVRDSVFAANEHRDAPFEKLVEALHPERDRSRTPIFQVMFAFMNVPGARQAWDDLDITLIERDSGTAEFDLSLYCYDPGSRPEAELTGWIEYSSALFDSRTVERMAAHLQRLASQVVAAPDRPIADISLLSESESRTMLAEWNDTAADYPREIGVHHLFERNARGDPGRVAAQFDDGETLTYGELDLRASRLARHLRKLGVCRDSRVAICTDRSSAMLVGLLGILKAGGAYVPLDPAFPAERLEYMLSDCGATILLTLSRLRDVVPASAVTQVCLDTDWPRIAEESHARLDGPFDPASLAYVIYTSGSTGKPKGVQIEHRAVVNFLNAMRARPGMTEHDRLLAVTTMSFDIHVLELFLPLAVGGVVVVAGQETAADPSRLIERLAMMDVTMMQATPSTWRMLLDTGWTGCPALKALCGGEALPADLAGMLLARCRSLWNMYGPTEATVWACVERIVDADAPIAVGHPFDNVRCYILDGRGMPVPVGVPGELCIGGVCVARGYLGRPELTRERFGSDPFIAGERIYRTGDMARFIDDGRIVILGRIDRQVKVRGHRIELGEIEGLLTAHPAIAQCVVIVREDEPGDQRLVVYAIAAAAERPSIGSLRELASSRLPDYMLPSAVVWLDRLPQTPNGKIDRRALPPPVRVERGEPAQSDALSATERVFADIFADVLGVKGVGRYDNFFDLGGHSLLAMRVVDRFRKATGLRMQPGELFQQTVGQLAAHYEELIEGGDVAQRSGLSSRVSGAVKSLLRKGVAK